MNLVLRITCWTFLVLLTGPSFSASTYELLKLPGSWQPVFDGKMDDWPEEYFIDSIRGDTNILANSSGSRPWQRNDFQCKVYAAYNESKIFIAVKVIADDSLNNCNSSARTCDNLRIHQMGKGTEMYVFPDGSPKPMLSCPWTIGVSAWVAARLSENTKLPVYEIALDKEQTAPFGAATFALFIGTSDVDGQVACDSGGGLCLDTTIVGVGVDAYPPMGEKSAYPTFTFSTRVGPSLPKTTHVFWYKCIQNNYALQDSPGPNLPSNIIRHEGMVMSSCMYQTSRPLESLFGLGCGLYDMTGICGTFWLKDLCETSGICTKAIARAEFRDGWSGSAFCNAGPIRTRVGVVDFQGNLEAHGGNENVPETSVWADGLYPLSPWMGYNAVDSASLMAQETLQIMAPAGRPNRDSGSILDKKFFELDVTDQVNWILGHTGNNKGTLSGQYAIVALVNIDQGSTGLFKSYTNENCEMPVPGSDSPWTKDGNTFHLVVESDNLSFVSAESPVLSHPQGVALGSIHPNPFKGMTAIPYNTGTQSTGILRIYRPDGKLVFSASVSGQGQMKWDATSRAMGLYFCRLIVGRDIVSRAIVLMR